jgi:hypothetical protein
MIMLSCRQAGWLLLTSGWGVMTLTLGGKVAGLGAGQGFGLRWLSGSHRPSLALDQCLVRLRCKVQCMPVTLGFSRSFPCDPRQFAKQANTSLCKRSALLPSLVHLLSATAATPRLLFLDFHLFVNFPEPLHLSSNSPSVIRLALANRPEQPTHHHLDRVFLFDIADDRDPRLLASSHNKTERKDIKSRVV